MVVSHLPTIQSSDGLIIRRSAAISSCAENKNGATRTPCYRLCATFLLQFSPMLVDAIAERLICGSPTRARTWDLRINSPSTPTSK